MYVREAGDPVSHLFSYLFRQIKVEMGTRETTCSAAPRKMYSMQLSIQSRYAGYTKRRGATEMTVIVQNETSGIRPYILLTPTHPIKRKTPALSDDMTQQSRGEM